MKTKTCALFGVLVFLIVSTTGCGFAGFHFRLNVNTTEANAPTKVCEFTAIDVSASSGGKKGTQFQNYIQALRRQLETPVCGTRYVLFRSDEKVENDDILIDADLPDKNASELGMGCLQKKSTMQKTLSHTLDTLNADAPGSDLLGLLWTMAEASNGCAAVNITIYSDLFIHTRMLNTNFIAMPSQDPETFFKKHISKDMLPSFRPHVVQNFTVIRHTQDVEPAVVRWTERLWKWAILPHVGIPGSRATFQLVTQNTL